MRNFLSISGGNIIRQITTFLAQMLIAKHAGSSAFGLLTLAFSVYFILAGFGDMGSRLYCWNTVLKEEPEKRLDAAFRLLFYRIALVCIIILPINIVIFFVSKGQLALLLHMYTIAIIFNQVAFDWFFLSLDKIKPLFFFNAMSGIFYLVGVAVLVESSKDIIYVPIIFAISYAIPAAFLIGKEWIKKCMSIAKQKQTVEFIKNILQLPFHSYRYFFYDILQRAYNIFIFMLAGIYYNNKIIGEFRVAHLMYFFIVTLSIFLGASYFNRVSEEVRKRGKTSLIGNGVGLILLLILPLSLAGQDVVPLFVKGYFGKQYENTLSVISLLLYALLIPAFGNFIREVAVSTKYSSIAAWSLAVTIFVSSIMLIFYHPESLYYLGLVLIIGELSGLILLAVLLPFQIIPRKIFSMIVISFGFAMLLKIIFYITDKFYKDIKLLTLNMTIGGVLYLVYFVFVNKRTKYLL